MALLCNEDGAQPVCAELFQAFNDVGFTVAASSGTYRVGHRDYRDLAANTAHPARLPHENPYPPKTSGG